ncbi:sigma-70 family RNA polymerase sigma factor [Thermodesulfobacteriota bacterium]
MKRTNKYTQAEPPSCNRVTPDEREKLISQYAPLVKIIAGRLALRLPQHVSQDDLASAGIMGLLDALDKFDTGKGVEFKSYAEFRIRGAMIDELRSMDWVPRSVRSNAKKIEKAYSNIENREMRPARDEEVALELGMELDLFHKLLEEVRGISIINEYDIVASAAESKSEETGIIDLPGISSNPADSLNRVEVRDVIAKAIERLPKNERTVISLYYYEELTMKEIGNIMGYTESRVSQLHTKATFRLRSSLKDYFDK